MPHITVPNGAPGTLGPFTAFPEQAQAMRGLAEAFLRSPSLLSLADREVIATHVSHGNRCHFCTQSHAAAARALLGAEHAVMDEVLATGAVQGNEKLSALLVIADQVREGGRSVTAEAIERARAAGAGDEEIHHTVGIAAAFCMFNRYVDGLATEAPKDPADYVQMGQGMAANGYLKRAREAAQSEESLS